MKPLPLHEPDVVPGEPVVSSSPVRTAMVVVLLVLCYSGYLKASPFLGWLEVDLTLLSALVVLLAVTIRVACGGRPLAGFGLVAALWCFWLPGAAIAAERGFDQYKTLLLFTVTLLCAIAPFFLITGARAEKYWINGHVACAAVFAATLVLFPDDGLRAAYSNQLNLEGGNTISAARLVGAGVLIAFLRALMTRRVSNRVVWWALTAVGSIVVAAIGSRGPFLALIIAGLSAVLLSAVFAGRRLRVVTWSTTAVAGLLFYVYEGRGALNDRIGLLFSQGGEEARQELYHIALRSIEANPFGIGWGGFGRLPSVATLLGRGDSAYPHNLFLEVFVEGGLVAVIALVFFIINALVRIRRASTDTTGSTLFALTIYWLVAAQTSSDINSNRMTWAALAVGLAAAAARGVSSAGSAVAQPGRKDG